MKNKYKMTIGFFLVLLFSSSCVQTSQNVNPMATNIQTTTDYDGIWQLKMYVGPKYYQDKISVVNGQFYKKYPNGTILKGYISGDGRFVMYHSFNHGGWNSGDFSFTLDRKRSSTTRLVGKWNGLDGAHRIQDGQKYGSGSWEVIISQQQSIKIDRDKSSLSKNLIQSSTVTGTWEGISDDLTGKFKTNSTKNNGFLEVKTYNPNMTCSGQWMWAKGEYGSKIPPQGTWSIACDNRTTASGTYISHKPGEGGAEGIDNQNRKIKLKFNNWMRVSPVRNSVLKQSQNPSTYPINGKWKISGIEKDGKYVEAKSKEETIFIFNGNSFDIVVDRESLTDAFSHTDEFELGKISYNVKNGKITLSNPAEEKLTADIEFLTPTSLRVSNFRGTHVASLLAMSIIAAFTGEPIFPVKKLTENTTLYFVKQEDTL